MKPTVLALCGTAILSLCLTACGDKAVGKPPAPREASAPTGEKIELKMNLPKGAKKDLVAKIDIGMDIAAEGEKMKMTMDMRMDMGFEVLNVDAKGNQEVSFKFDRMKMDIAGPAEVDYDSDRPGSDETLVGAEIAPMIGYPIVMTMSPTGEVLEIGDLSDAPAALREQFEQSQNNFEMVATYPDVPVDNGDTLVLETSKIENGMKMDMSATYTLLEHKDGEAWVGVHGDLKGGLTGWIHGDMRIDLATGWVKSAALKMKAGGEQDGAEVLMDMDMTFSDGSPAP